MYVVCILTQPHKCLIKLDLNYSLLNKAFYNECSMLKFQIKFPSLFTFIMLEIFTHHFDISVKSEDSYTKLRL